MIKKLVKKAGKLLKKANPLSFSLKLFKKLQDWLIPNFDQPGIEIERSGTDHHIPVIYGEVGKANCIKILKHGTESDKRFYHCIAVFSEGPIEAIDELFFDGISENDDRFKKGNGKWFHKEIFLGTPNQPHCSTLTQVIPNWDADCNLPGLAYVYVRFEADSDYKVWGSKDPEITARIRGRKVLDIRTGQMVYSSNPALCLYDYLRNNLYGYGIDQNRLLQQLITSAANFYDNDTTYNITREECYYDPQSQAYVCNPAIVESRTQKLLTFNCIIDTGSTVMNNVREMLQGMRAWLPLTADKLRLIVETSGEPVFDITQDMQIGSIRTVSENRSERYNRVIVRYKNKDKDYESDEVVYPPKDSTLHQTWLDEDNGILNETSVLLRSITSTGEALQMAELIAKRSRHNRTYECTVLPIGLKLEPGDLVAVYNDLRGIEAKPYRVMSLQHDADLNVTLKLREHQNAVYPWSGTDYSEIIRNTNLGDPSAVPAPANLVFTSDMEQLYSGTLSWSMPSSLLMYDFEVRLISIASESIVISEVTRALSFKVPLLDAGVYTISVKAINSLGFSSSWSSLNFELRTPIPPIDILFTVGNFEIEARPVLPGAGLGTQFEFAIGTVDVIRGRGTSMVFTGLSHSTEYTVYARTINALGISAWTDRIATTTADGSNIVDLIGEDIGNQIFDNVLEQVNDNLQAIVDQAVQDLPSVTDVQNVINEALADIDQQAVEDPRVFFVESINNIFDNYETAKEVKNEALQRKVEFDRLDVSLEGAFSEITEAKQVLVDLEQATSESISQVSSRIEDEKSAREAAVFTLQQSVVNEGQARALAMQLVNSKIDDETSTREAQVQTIQQSVVDESSARAQAIQTVNAAIQQEGTTRTAQVQTLNQAITNESTNRAQAIQTLTVTVNNNNLATIARFDSVESTVNGNTSAIQSIQGQVNNPSTGLSAAFSLAQSAKTTADNTAQSLTLIQNQVSNPTTGLAATAQLAQGASVKADGALSATAGLTTEISGKVKAMANNGATLVLVGTNTAAYSTNNGASWVQVDIPPGFYTDVVYLSATQRFYAVGNGVIARSTTNNGSAWEAIAIPANIPSTWNSVSYISNLFVFIGTNLCVTANQALTTFTERTIPPGAYVKVRGNGNANIAVNNKIVAVGDNVAAVSTNGTSWSNCPIPAGKYVDLAVGMLRWIAVKAGGIAVSENDGTSFTRNLLTSVSQNWKGIISAAVDSDRVWLLADSKVFYTNATAIGSNAGWTATTAPVHGDTLTHALMYKAIAINGANITVVGTIGAATSSNTGGSWTRRNLPAALQRVSRAALILDTSETEAGEANSRAFLGVTNIVDGRAVINGITIDGATNALEFRADTLRLSDTNGNVQLYWNAGQNSWFFGGRLSAGIEINAPKIRGGELVIADNSVDYMSIVRAIPFGSANDLVEWFGPRINGVTWNNTTQQPIYSGMTKLNAKTYKTRNGDVFFGGTFQAGALSISRQSTTSSGSLVVNSDPFTIPSNTTSLSVTASLTVTGSQLGAGSCPVELPSFSLIVNIERLVNGVWQNIGGNNASTTATCTPEGPEIIIALNGGLTVNTSLAVNAGQSVSLRATAVAPSFPAGIAGLNLQGTRSLSLAISGV